jgi:hypothetical protein
MFECLSATKHTKKKVKKRTVALLNLKMLKFERLNDDGKFQPTQYVF